jgi:oligopeptide/dipeptide ABC transporter ATP-binding protein
LSRTSADEVMVMYLRPPSNTARRTPSSATPQHPYTRMLLAATPSIDPARRKQSVTIKGDLPRPWSPHPAAPSPPAAPTRQAQCVAERPEPRSFAGRSVRVSQSGSDRGSSSLLEKKKRRTFHLQVLRAERGKARIRVGFAPPPRQ